MGITRRGSRWIGYLIVLLALGLAALIGVSTLDALVSTGSLLLVGSLFVLAGVETPLTRRFGWHRILGLGFVVMGFNQLTNLSFGTDDVFYAIATVSLAGVFAFMGFDIARGGPHFEVDPDETV